MKDKEQASEESANALNWTTIGVKEAAEKIQQERIDRIIYGDKAGEFKPTGHYDIGIDKGEGDKGVIQRIDEDGSITELADWPPNLEQESKDVTDKIQQRIVLKPRSLGITTVLAKDIAIANLSSKVVPDNQKQYIQNLEAAWHHYVKMFGKHPSDEELDKHLGEMIAYQELRLKTPQYSKAQINSALANQKRALRAGKKLKKKQKAEANRCRPA